ncbi:MAG: translation initiation factor IF-2 [Clostridiales bacterium]|nr:translation initiation factor IF-2 [Clostridiales bacterium]
MSINEFSNNEEVNGAKAKGSAEGAGKEEPKKKRIIRVVRPQNAQQGNSRRSGNNNNRRKDSNSSSRSGAPRGERSGNGASQNRKPNKPIGPTRPIAGERPVLSVRPTAEIRHELDDKTPGRTIIIESEKKPSKKEKIAPEVVEAAPAAVVQEETSVKAAEAPKAEETKVEKTAFESKDKKSETKAKTFGEKKAEFKEKAFKKKNDKGFEKREDGGDHRGKNERGGRFGKKNDDARNSGPFRRDNKNGRMSVPASEENSMKQNSKDSYNKKKSRKDQYQQGDRFDKKAESKKAGAFHKPVKVDKPKEEELIKMITVPTTITIQELADKMKIQPSTIVKKLFMKGTLVTINQEIEYQMAEEIAMDFDVLCEPEKEVDVLEELLREEEEDESKMVPRSPVVCVMGHVDHGKTSLLDKIRHTNVTDKEAGGITQHIGAYVVKINGENITFLDTPGHEAFTSMRMRGASSTDIAVLVVAADDGVMPQTVEAINHARAAGVEIIVAVNKIDKPGANVEKVKQGLSEYNLIPEEWGGSTVFVPVSAKTGEGIENLLEMIVLTAEMLELKANPKRQARGLVLEAKLDKGRGPVATVLVQKGTLKVGQSVAAGTAYGKVRAMIDDKGRRVKEAGPSTPVEILGLNEVPGAGDVFIGPKTDKEARHFAETFISHNKIQLVSENKSKLKMSLDDLYAQIKEGNLKELDIIVKADVQGSVEAVRQSLEKLSNDEVVVKVIHGAVGAISESDVSLASASNAIIIGFNVRPDAMAKDTAESEGVDIRLYRVIYNAIEDIEAAMKGMLDPEFKEEVIGHAEVRQIFHASGVGTIAGSYVKDGKFERSAETRIIRDGVVVYEGSLASLRRFKDDVKEVRAGYECAFVFESYNDVKEGDVVEAFKMVEVAR